MTSEQKSKSFDPLKSYSKYGIRWYQNPQILFVIMGAIIIAAIVATDVVAKKFADQEIVALIVLFLSAFLLVIGTLIIHSFERIAKSAMAKSEFISIMSHQLRNPLSAIKWQLEPMISDKTLSLSPEVSGILVDVNKQNESMIKMVNDLLELNKIEDGLLDLDKTSFSIIELAQKVFDENKEFANKNDITLEMMIKREPPLVFADRGRIKSIISHLIDNAVRYSKGKGKVILVLESSNDNSAVTCSVVDEGIGLPEEETKKVFSKFFRGSGQMRYQTSGAGLGLYISKYIIEQSGGKMGFSTIEGRGSTFWFSLPAAPTR